jgi:hypothetical protein
MVPITPSAMDPRMPSLCTLVMQRVPIIAMASPGTARPGSTFAPNTTLVADP